MPGAQYLNHGLKEKQIDSLCRIEYYLHREFLGYFSYRVSVPPEMDLKQTAAGRSNCREERYGYGK